MPRHFLQPFELTVVERGTTQALPVDAFDGSHSALDVVGRMFRQIREVGSHDTRKKRVVRHRGDILQTATSVSGLLRAGEYGLATDLYNVEVDTETPKAANVADLFTHYVRFDATPGATRAVVVLHKIGQRSILEPIKLSLKGLFRLSYPEFVPSLDRLVPLDVLRQYLDEGALKEITVKRFGVRRDRNDFLAGDGGLAEQVGTFYEIYKPARGQAFRTPGFLQRILAGESFTDVVAVNDRSIVGVSVELEIAGEKRRVHLDDLDRFPNSFDVTAALDYDAGSNPTFESIDREARRLAEHFMQRVGMR